MKRLLCLVSMMDTGGAETFLMKLYRVLDTSKYQMDFCVNVNRKCFFDDEITRRGGIIYHIPSKSYNPIEFVKQLKSIVKTNKYEYVLKITSNAIGFLDLMIAKKAGARVCTARSSNSSDGDDIMLRLSHKIGKLLFKKYVDIEIAPSKAAGIYTFGFQDVENQRVTILHNGVDLDYYRFSVEDRRRIRSEFSISDSTILIGHIGRFTTQKNHEFLLRVFKRVRDIRDNYKLLLIGTGELEPKIKEMVDSLNLSNDVFFGGIRSDIPSLLSAMDLFVFPSLYEGMPNTVIEAQATGLPCIISDSITSESVINDNVLQLSLHSIDLWTKVILQAVNDNDRWNQDRLIEANYDIHDIVNSFTRLVIGE